MCGTPSSLRISSIRTLGYNVIVYFFLHNITSAVISSIRTLGYNVIGTYNPKRIVREKISSIRTLGYNVIVSLSGTIRRIISKFHLLGL